MLRKLKNWFRRSGLLLANVISLAVLIVVISTADRTLKPDYPQFQERFYDLENTLESATANALDTFSKAGETGLMRTFSDDPEIFLHIYRNDSLVCWNTNEMPVYHLADLHFPVKGLVRLQNGWYYTEIIKRGKLVIAGSFLVKHDYPYENQQLRNAFNPKLWNGSAAIILEQKGNASIRNRKGEFLFSLEHIHTPEEHSTADVWIFVLLLLVGVFTWAVLNQWFKSAVSSSIIAVLFFALRYFSIIGNWLSPLTGNELFDPSVLALSEWTPNLAALILSFLVFLFGVRALLKYLRKLQEGGRFSKSIALVGLLLLPLLMAWMCSIARTIVENSSIPLQLDELFMLTRYSLLILLLIGISGFVFIIIVYELVHTFLRTGGSKIALTLAWIIGNAVFVCWTAWYFSWISAVWPVATSTSVMLFALRNSTWNFTSALAILLLFSVGTASGIHEFAEVKERGERELYANQLSDDRDVATELEYGSTRKQLLSDSYLERLSSRQNKPGFSELKEAMERRVFTGFWERYDIDCFYYQAADSLTRLNGKRRKDLELLINRHGIISDMDSSMFFIKDYTSQYSYVIREQLKTDTSLVWLYCTLKSKRIPEEIGFPRLLISDKAKVFESLEKYSIAKYYNGKLVTRYGEFSFPFEADALSEAKGRNRYFFNKDGFNHFLLRRTDKDLILLSRKNGTWVDWVTTVAFLFVLYGGLLAVLVVLYTPDRRLAFSRLSFAGKIQLVLIGLVVLSLLGFSLGSSKFVGKQYEQYTNGQIREKVHAVGTVAKLRLGNVSSVNVAGERGDLDYYLRSWAQIFVTDVNVYNLEGRLVGTSRSKIYNIGLLGEQMNPLAKRAMMLDKKSEYIHRERIGKLVYLSAYMPFFNNDGRIIAYLNLQHFDQQNELEQQIQHYLVAIINVFMLLLAFSIVGAIFVSNWLTFPLRMIQKSFSKVELGKHNQAIDYHSKDEIGDLVRGYNQKLTELEAAVLQLAQNERESAWREMAKQVAHEIKNPLTPMKLSIQQLQRVFDPDDPDSKQKIDRVSQSIIEQIDALTSIANAFSNFARMPQPKTERIKVKSFLESLVAVYEAENATTVLLQSELSEAYIKGDRELLLRVMNNVITNSLQAIPANREGRIVVAISSEGGQVIIRIKDNGAGIPEEQLATVFEPYFTTKSTGTGLGLAMVKQIVEGHEGTIGVEKTGASGTTMILRFRQER